MSALPTSDPVIQSQFNKSRKDKFLLVIQLPEIMRSVISNDLSIRSDDFVNQDSIQFSVYGAVVPEISVPANISGYSGQSIKTSSLSRPPYPNITVNFTVDNRFNNYWVIYKWLNLLNDQKTSLYNSSNIVPSTQVSNNGNLNKALSPASYQTDFTLYGKDEFDQNIVQFTYTKAFPVSLGSIDYSYRNAEEIETTFEFAFSQFFVDLV